MAYFFIERKKEDTRVLKTLKIKPIHLDFTDAAWREQEKNLEKRITLTLKKLIKGNNKDMVFCPIGVGRHVDHLIIRNICQKTFRKVVYWQDYPYVLWDKADQEFIRKNKLKKTIFRRRFNKNKLIMGYESQTKIFFKYDRKIKTVPEQYFFQGKLLLF